jgi:hypothetical protein
MKIRATSEKTRHTNVALLMTHDDDQASPYLEERLKAAASKISGRNLDGRALPKA